MLDSPKHPSLHTLIIFSASMFCTRQALGAGG